MGVPASRMVMLLLCIAFFSFQANQVSGLGSIDLALRFLRNSRLLEGVAVEQLGTKTSIAPSPSTMFDPNLSDKRRVRRGSDPIHNRCWYTNLWEVAKPKTSLSEKEVAYGSHSYNGRRNLKVVVNFYFLWSSFFIGWLKHSSFICSIWSFLFKQNWRSSPSAS